MLGGKFQFVKFEETRIEREGKDNLHFANVTVSDGLESLEFVVDLKLAPKFDELKRKQNIEIATNMRKVGYNYSVTVNELTVL